MRGELLEFADDLGHGREVLLAATRRFARAFEALAAAQVHFHPHHVAELRAFRGDRRIGHDLDLVGERDALRVRDGIRSELGDGAIACEERPACMRFTIAPYCAAIRPAACVPARPSAWTVLAASRRSPRAAPAAAEKTPSVAPECQPCSMCRGPMHSPTRGPIS